MKLLIALTPGILIGCAFVETCVGITSKKQPATAEVPAAPVQTAAAAAPPYGIFPLGTKSTTPGTGTLSMAQLRLNPESR